MTSRPWDPFQAHSQRTLAAPKTLEVPVPQRSLSAPPLQVIGGVPVGTTVQIQDWVGDDPERAQSAWKREREQDRPRITLLTHLESVLKRHNLGPTPVPIGPSPAIGGPVPQESGPIPVERDPGLWREETDEQEEQEERREPGDPL